jgi:hypothetical protein
MPERASGALTGRPAETGVKAEIFLVRFLSSGRLGVPASPTREQNRKQGAGNRNRSAPVCSIHLATDTTGNDKVPPLQPHPGKDSCRIVTEPAR